MMQKKLSEEEIRYQELVNHLPVGVYRTTVEGKIVECNQALATVLGFDNAEQLKGENVRQFYLNPEDRSAHQAKLSIYGTYFSEFQLLTKDKRIIWVRDFPRVTRNAANEIVYYDGIIIDITELKESEESRLKLISRLQEALEKIETLHGLLPICSRCKKIRNDRGYWEALESYLHKHSTLRFSHAICPECAAILYPELNKNQEETKKE